MAFQNPLFLTDATTPIVNSVRSYVDAGIATASGYATTAYGQVTTFLNTLSGLVVQIGAIPTVNTILGPILAPLPVYQSPTLPTEPGDMDVTMPDAPAPFIPPAIAGVNLPPTPILTAEKPIITLPTAPETLVLDMPVAPELVDVAMPDLPAVVLPDAPTPLAVNLPGTPNINLPMLPSPLTGEVGNAPTLPDVQVPQIGDITLPDLPTFIGINIPSTPVLNLPTFAGTLPTAPSAISSTFSFTEDANYESQFFTDVRTYLDTWVQGASTGIAPSVEAQIWNRARSRNAAATMRSSLNAVRNYAARNFRKPPGALARELREAGQEAQSADLNASRDIAIAQADLEQKNRQFAITKAIDSEIPLIGYRGQVQQRALETAKYAQEVAIQILQALIQRYQGEVSAYEAQARVFDTLVRAELAQLEIFRTQLEAQKLLGEMNMQQVEIYKARVAALGLYIDIGKARIEAANIALQGNKLRVEVFGAEVNAFEAKARAKATEYQGYEAAARAELTKTEVYKGELQGQELIVRMNESLNSAYRTRVEAAGLPLQYGKLRVEAASVQDGMNKSRVDRFSAMVGAQGERARAAGVNAQVYEAVTRAQGILGDLYGKLVDAFQAETQAFGTTVDALTKGKELEIRTSVDAPLQAKKIETEIYGIRADAEGKRVDAKVKVFGNRTNLYDAQVRGEIARTGSQTEVYKSSGEIIIKEADLRLRQASDNVQAMIQRSNILVEAARGGGQVAGQVAAGALSAFHMSANISASGSANTSNSQSNSVSNTGSSSDSYTYSRSDTWDNTKGVATTSYNYSGSV